MLSWWNAFPYRSQSTLRHSCHSQSTAKSLILNTICTAKHYDPPIPELLIRFIPIKWRQIVVSVKREINRIHKTVSGRSNSFRARSIYEPRDVFVSSSLGWAEMGWSERFVRLIANTHLGALVALLFPILTALMLRDVWCDRPWFQVRGRWW